MDLQLPNGEEEKLNNRPCFIEKKDQKIDNSSSVNGFN